MATSTFYDKIVIDEDAARILAEGLNGPKLPRPQVPDGIRYEKNDELAEKFRSILRDTGRSKSVVAEEDNSMLDTTNARVERALDYAETIDPGETLTDEQRQRRREFGREFATSFVDGIDWAMKIARGEIPRPEKSNWLNELQKEVESGDFSYEED